MKKSSARWWVIWTVVLAVYNVIVFAVPFPKNAVFFVSWAFTLIAIAAQIYVVRSAFYRGEGAKSKFYGWPIAKLGAVYLIAQLGLGLAFMALGFAVSVPVWIPVVLYAMLLGAAAVGLISTEATRDEISRQDTKLKKDVSCMRTLQSKAMAMVPLAKDASVRTALERFAEEIRFSDPVSGAALEAAEADLSACVNDLQQAVLDNDQEAALTLEKRAEMLLAERNRLCKLEKRAAH